MGSTEVERMSLLLSTLLERKYIGTEEFFNMKKDRVVLQECMESGDIHDIIHTGSSAEGCFQKGSDLDAMLVNKSVVVMYPDDSIPLYSANKTILYIREAVGCRPGFVHLEVVQMNGEVIFQVYNSLVEIGNSIFISSDLYREEHITNHNSVCAGICLESNGPSCTVSSPHSLGYGDDCVHCFPCYSWPKEAKEWITRERMNGWPSQTLIDKIVKGGCYLVPIGDKCSEDTFLQWRISFAVAERCLVHSFTFIQVKVYILLKYFLKQIKETLKETIGDDDILCSYFMKTVMFHAIENTSQMLWQDKNLFYCFWFCINILIAWVRAGFCPNYFIPANNLFKRKVHGQHQQILLDLLENYGKMKWLCLSLGNFYKPSIWEELCNISMQAFLVRPLTVHETFMYTAFEIFEALGRENLTRGNISKRFNLLSTSKSDFEELFTYSFTMASLRCFASERFTENVNVSDNGDGQDNKERYRRLRKCKIWMSPNASFGTDVLHLATYHFVIGNISKCLKLSRDVIKPASFYRYQTLNPDLLPRLCEYSLKTIKKVVTKALIFQHSEFYFPHLCLELTEESFFWSCHPCRTPYS